MKSKIFLISACILIMLFLSYCVKTEDSALVQKQFDTKDECVSSTVLKYQLGFNDELDSEHFDYCNKIYSSMDENKIIEIFSSSDLTIWIYVIEITEENDSVKYEVINSRDVITFVNYWQYIDDFKYMYVSNESQVALPDEDVIKINVDISNNNEHKEGLILFGKTEDGPQS